MDKMKSLFLSSLLVVVSTSGLAQNPIIQTNYTADPAPMVYNDKVYLYTTHDEDNSTWFTMNDWRLYTTSDMVNWRIMALCYHILILVGQKGMHGLHNALREMVSFICTYP